MIKTILISRQVLRLYLITLLKNFKKHFKNFPFRERWQWRFVSSILEEDKLVFDLLEIKNMQDDKEKGFVIFKIYNKMINILRKNNVSFFLSRLQKIIENRRFLLKRANYSSFIFRLVFVAIVYSTSIILPILNITNPFSLSFCIW